MECHFWRRWCIDFKLEREDKEWLYSLKVFAVYGQKVSILTFKSFVEYTEARMSLSAYTVDFINISLPRKKQKQRETLLHFPSALSLTCPRKREEISLYLLLEWDSEGLWV